MGFTAALQIAKKIKALSILDIGCGVGGSAIGFARTGKRVIAVDSDKNRLEMAKFNAEIFDVRAQIEFHHADFRDVLLRARFESIHLDLDWGGASYRAHERFGLSDFVPDAADALQRIIKRTRSVIFKVPKNFEFDTLPELYTSFMKLRINFGAELLHYYLVRREDLLES